MIALLSALVLKGSILMLAAAVTVAVMYRASAATRHFVWTLSVAGLLLLPIVATALPAWEIAVPIARGGAAPFAAHQGASASSVPIAVTELASATPVDTAPTTSFVASVSWLVLPAIVYIAGLVVLLGRLVMQRRTATRLARHATVVSDPEWTALLEDCARRIGVSRPVTLVRSREPIMPMTMGTVAPVIVVPADADAWDDERRTAVLLHELAHISRYDCLTQTLCAIVSTVYWLHPGVWYIARRLRIEREVASDDCVLAAGAHAGRYAGHLLELAYGWSGRRAPALVVGMAGSRKLEGRMRAVLDPARNRTAPGRRVWLAGAAVGAAVLIPIAAFTVTTTTASQRDFAAVHQTPIESVFQSDAGSTDTREQTSGTWEVRPADSPWRLALRVRLGDASFSGEIGSSEFERLAGQPLSAANGPIRFSIPREAGTFEIAGTIQAGAGTGTFRFVPSESFITNLTGRGFARPSAGQLMAMAQRNIGLAFIDELAAQKYVQPAASELIRAADHGVDLNYLCEIGQAGYRVGTLDALIRFRDHGVDAGFLGGLADLGYAPTAFDRIVRARDHGVTPDYVAVLRDAGYAKLPLEDVIRTRDHGVDPEYIREMREAGYTLTLTEMINTRDHGVTPDYVQMMAALGYQGLPIETVVRLRDHGVTPDFVQELKRRGYNNLSVDEIIRLRDRGESHSSKTVLNYLHYRIARLWQKISNGIDVEEFLDKALKKI